MEANKSSLLSHHFPVLCTGRRSETARSGIAHHRHYISISSALVAFHWFALPYSSALHDSRSFYFRGKQEEHKATRSHSRYSAVCLLWGHASAYWDNTSYKVSVDLMILYSTPRSQAIDCYYHTPRVIQLTSYLLSLCCISQSLLNSIHQQGLTNCSFNRLYLTIAFSVFNPI